MSATISVFMALTCSDAVALTLTLVHACREDDAAAALTSGGAFKRKVQAMCGRQLPAPAHTQQQAARPMPACQNRQGAQTVGAVSARPIGDFLNKIGEGIFVGTFRGTSPAHPSHCPVQQRVMPSFELALSKAPPPIVTHPIRRPFSLFEYLMQSPGRGVSAQERSGC